MVPFSLPPPGPTTVVQPREQHTLTDAKGKLRASLEARSR